MGCKCLRVVSCTLCLHHLRSNEDSTLAESNYIQTACLEEKSYVQASAYEIDLLGEFSLPPPSVSLKDENLGPFRCYLGILPNFLHRGDLTEVKKKQPIMMAMSV